MSVTCKLHAGENRSESAAVGTWNLAEGLGKEWGHRKDAGSGLYYWQNTRGQIEITWSSDEIRGASSCMRRIMMAEVSSRISRAMPGTDTSNIYVFYFFGWRRSTSSQECISICRTETLATTAPSRTVSRTRSSRWCSSNRCVGQCYGLCVMHGWPSRLVRLAQPSIH